MRHALAEFRSERYLRVNGGPAPELWDKIAGLYPWRRALGPAAHQFPPPSPRRRAAPAPVRGTPRKRCARRWAAGGRGVRVRGLGRRAGGGRHAALADTWRAHPQAQAIAGMPPVTIEKIGEAPPQPLLALPDHAEINVDARPLSGVRRARLHADHRRPGGGAHAGRAWRRCAAGDGGAPAGHRAAGDRHRARQAVLPARPARPGRQAHAAQAAAWRRRGGAGLPPGRAGRNCGAGSRRARARPGIVYVSLSAYGHVGPWAGKRGFDSLVQTATGFNDDEARAAGSAEPKPLPAQVLDHAAGYLLAFRAMAALHRRAAEGGSWHVRVSLAQVGQWLRSLGRVPEGWRVPDPHFDEMSDLLEVQESGFGELDRGAPCRAALRDARALGAALGAARHPRPGVAAARVRLGKTQFAPVSRAIQSAMSCSMAEPARWASRIRARSVAGRFWLSLNCLPPASAPAVGRRWR